MRTLRSAAAFLLSLHSVAMAELSIAGRVSGMTMALVLLAGLMSLLGDGPSSERVQRDRAATYRMGSLWSIYALYLITALMMVSSSDRGFAGVLVGLVACMQLVFLAWSSIGPRAVPLLVNALGLCLFAGPAGGLLPLLSVAGYAPLAALLLVLDHHHLRRASPARAWRPALGQAALAALVLWPFLPLLPLAAGLHAGTGAAAQLSWSDLSEATVDLVVTAGLGLGLILLARWLWKRLRGEEDAAPTGELEATAEAGTPAELPSPLPPLELDLAGARGDIIRVFERFLAAAAKLGYQRRPNWTAAEFARRLPLPASRLARLFGRARYSEEELLEKDASAAAADADTVLARLREL